MQCNHSLEAACWDASNEYPQHKFKRSSKKDTDNFLVKNSVIFVALSLLISEIEINNCDNWNVEKHFAWVIKDRRSLPDT